MSSLLDPISTLKYVGPEKAEIFNSKGILTFADLWNYFPYKYRDTSHIVSICELYDEYQRLPLFEKPIEKYTVIAKVTKSKKVYTRSRKVIVEAEFMDENHEDSVLHATWFFQPFVLQKLTEGNDVILYGKVIQKGKGLAMINPEVEVKQTNKDLVHLGKVTAVYRSISSISPAFFRRYLNELIKVSTPPYEYLSKEMLHRFQLVSLEKAYKSSHAPDSLEEANAAYTRLALQELLELRQGFDKDISTKSQKVFFITNPQFLKIEKFKQELIKRLPFTLTKSQVNALDELLPRLLLSKTKESLLLYGDVGSGKTIILSLLAVLFISLGKTVVILVPTAVLAEQHYETFIKLTGVWGFPKEDIILRTSRKKATLETGKIIIGTHALLSLKAQSFDNTGLIVVDEQHKFGVTQREKITKLLENNETVPHMLALSATPIPRSLAESFLGYSHTIVLKDKPFDKNNIKTKIVLSEQIDKMYKWIAKEVVRQNRQAFLVFPAIDPSDISENSSLLESAEILQSTFFGDISIGILHGRMKEEEKIEIMKKFSKGEIKILLTTTVIEVGINVPTAFVIVIHNADRFGLAQLHQLRGRVGRDGNGAYCFVHTSSDKRSALERLEFFEKNTDGFSLAKYDLQNRGMGNLFGTEQSGNIQLKIAQFSDLALLSLSDQVYSEVKKENIALERYIIPEHEATSKY